MISCFSVMEREDESSCSESWVEETVAEARFVVIV